MSTDPIDAMSDAAFDAMWPDAASESPRLRLVDEPEDTLPDAETLAREQLQALAERMHYGWRDALHWRLPSLQRVAGPVQGGALVLVGGRTGHGKSLFFQNWWDDLIEAGHTGLYIGTEQDPDILRTKWACVRVGVSPRLVLAPEPHETGTPAFEQAQHAVQVEAKRLATGEYAQRAIFCTTRRISVPELVRWVKGGVRKYAINFVVVDHVDRMDTGNGRDRVREMTEAIVACKELAEGQQIRMLVASQVKRAADKLDFLTPPTLEDFAQSSDKEREADIALSVYRPMRPDVNADELAAVKQKRADPKTIWWPNVMGVKCLKHRMDDARLGASAFLDVAGHRLGEQAERDKYATTREGIRTQTPRGL